MLKFPIVSIDEFDVSNPISWDNYTEQLISFLKTNVITNAEKKRVVLLAVLRIKTLGVLLSLLESESPSTKSYNDLIKNFKENFTPTSSEIYRHFQFQERMQRKNGTVSFYVTELRRLEEECNFDTTLTERLRGQLVSSIKDEALQRQLLAESKLTFNEAFSKAVADESAAEQAKHIHSQKLNSGNSTI
ncbi:hypothetical protein AVEN_122259-1 [Araneus ventricosus]|uniref:Retrotransposon gag domain-containing protein n=1 Tax=Araneus ventricosus TaxID=182803 RepID=A0A4Y2PNF8_ARAVE|nr:hypothetical protein AVEN_122259-1 [Araneus ventricosus]